jgi:ornithine decarboxylase
VSFHVGSGCYDPSVYTDAIMRARKVFDMAEAIGYDFSLLDVGGGFEDALFEKAAMYLNEAIGSYFADRKGKVKIIAEPGRFYVSKAFKLAAHIIARRAPLPDNANPAAAADVPQPAPAKDTGAANAEEDAEAPKVMCKWTLHFSFFDASCTDKLRIDYINDGVYGAFNCILFDHQIIHPYVLSMGDSFHIPSSQPKHLASVWGPTCDSIDCVSPKTMLPTSLEVGDWLGFDNMGAYTVCAASCFNGFEVSNVVYTGGGGNEVREVLEEFAKEGFGI